ncbi:nucleolar transcription factor 1-A-like [Dermatophagoides pteronyssinus]|uniref:nucleolar transcription factor 1-A-like n=1 Tax=Dermatophagoides pteronyssinus TaxID=6956 RepID=UPI003F679227
MMDEEILISKTNEQLQLSDSSTTKRKKHKKSKLNHNEANNDSDITETNNIKIEDEDEMSLMMMMIADNNNGIEPDIVELSNDSVINDDFDSRWSTKDLKTLLENIKKCLPQNDQTKYSTTLEKTIDWNQIKFGNHDANECKECAVNIMNRLRKYRTLSEMLVDAVEWTDKRQLNHPDRPKKPCSLFLRYFLEKRPKLQAQYPDKSVAELAKLMSPKFAKLSEKKRAKYRREYEEDLIKYREQMIIFRSKHPEVFSQRMRTGEKIGPDKPRTPFQLFRLSRMKKIPPDTDEDAKTIQDRIREQWNNISDKKHYKFIKKSLKDQERYNNELEEFMAANPTYTAPSISKSLLTKNEQELRRRYQGMPARPPNSGYMLFSQIMLKEFKDVPSKEKMVLVAKRWKEMTQEERAKYKEDAQNMMSEYIRKFDDYVHTLPDEEKKQLLIEQGHFKFPSEKNYFSLGKQFMPTSSILALTKELRQKSAAIDQAAMVAYQMNEMHRLKPLFPDKSKTELMEIINGQWSSMPASEKSEYLEIAESMQDFLPTKTKKSPTNTTNKKESSSTTTTKEIKFKDYKESEFYQKTGLRKPRRCGFTAFCSQILSTMKDKTTQERMRFASEKWKTMSADEKQHYLDRQSNKCELFEKLFNRFKRNGKLPTKEEIKEFEMNEIQSTTTIDENEIENNQTETTTKKTKSKKAKKRKLSNNDDDDDDCKSEPIESDMMMITDQTSSSLSPPPPPPLSPLKSPTKILSSSPSVTTTIEKINDRSTTTTNQHRQKFSPKKSKKKFANCLYDDSSQSSSSASENDDDELSE